MTRHHLQVWTPEADAILAHEWEKATLSKRIAEILTQAGYPATKNSVLGRAYRRGFAKHEKANPRKTPAPFRLDHSKPLPPTGCRYIHGEPNGYQTKWCDAPVADLDGSWCPTHRAIVYQERNSEDGNTVPPQAQRSGTVALFPTISPMRVVA